MDIIDLFHESFRRCQCPRRDKVSFLHRFYEIFVDSSDEVKKKFRNTDIDHQVRMLTASFYFIMLASDKRIETQLYLERIADVHGKQSLDICPKLYDLWMDCLIDTVKEYDPHFSDTKESAWRAIMEPGINLMKKRY